LGFRFGVFPRVALFAKIIKFQFRLQLGSAAAVIRNFRRTESSFLGDG
jgi:hypothetical protein